MTQATPSYREATSARLVHCAIEILEQEGLEAVQARRLARDAGCSVGTIYNLFGDIDGLIIAVNAQTLARLGDAIRAGALAAHGGSLHERLEALALAYRSFAVANLRRWEAVFKHRLPPGRAVPASYLEDQASLLGVIEDALTEAVADAGMRSAVARGLFGAVHGVVALALDDRLGGQLGRELEQQLSFIADLAARGLAAGARVETPPSTQPTGPHSCGN